MHTNLEEYILVINVNEILICAQNCVNCKNNVIKLLSSSPFFGKRLNTYSCIMKVQSPYYYKTYKEVRMTYTYPVIETEMC